MKLKNFLLITFLAFVSFSCKTKVVDANSLKKEINYIPYYLKVYEADSLFITNNFEKSYQILDSLFQKYEPLEMENYYEYSNYIASSVMSGHVDGLDEKIKKGYLNFGGFGFLHPQGYEIRQKIAKISKLSMDEKNLYKKECSKKINLALRKEIDIMDDEDQSVRMKNLNEEGMTFFREKHREQLEKIMTTYGYPNYQLIGSMNYQDENWSSLKPIKVVTLFLHQDPDFQDKYLPVLLKKLKEGKCSPDDYASIYDKSLWKKSLKLNNEKQLYGTFPNLALDNPQKIDSIRKSIGLPKLGYEMRRVKKLSTKI